MAHSRVALVDRPIDSAELMREVAGPARGAICSFIGTVRNTHDGRAVTALEYSCYEAMALVELQQIAAEAQDRFGFPAIVAEHRVGQLGVGDVSVAIVTAHQRRANAIRSMEYVIEELKRRLPIWKLEHYADGDRAWVNAASAELRPSAGA